MTTASITHVVTSDNSVPLRALIYDRVSDDPSGSGRSVASQDVENRAFCERQGWSIVDTIQDNDLSASAWATKERPGFNEVARRMAAGEFDVLVCWENSRAQRDLEVYLRLRNLCQRHGVLWAYSGRVYDLDRTDDRFTTGLDALLSEREAGHTRDRILRGIRTQAALGAPHGTVPYGYRRDYHPVTRALVSQVPDQETAPIVQEIAERIISGDTVYTVVQDLNRRGVITPQGRKDRDRGVEAERAGWTSSKLRRLMSSSSIMGYRTHKGAVASVQAWEPLVSPQDFALVQSILADPKRAVHHRGVAVKYLLSGIAECGRCGAYLRPMMNRGRPSYACGGREENLGKGHVTCLRAPLNALVIARVVGRLSDPGFLEQLTRPQENHDVTAALREVKALRAQLADVVEQVRHRRMTPTLAGEIEAGILADIEAAQRRAVPSWVPLEVVDMAGADADAKWDGASLVTRRNVVRALQRVVLNPAGPARVFDPSRVDVIDL